jgi:hypothetical protein
MSMAGSERIRPFPLPGVNPSSLLVKFPPLALALRKHDRAPLPLVWKPGESRAAQSANLDEACQISWENFLNRRSSNYSTHFLKFTAHQCSS